MKNETIYYDDLLGIGFVMIDKNGNKMDSESVFNTGDYSNFAYLECKINDTLFIRFKDDILYLVSKINDLILTLKANNIIDVVDILKEYQSFDSFTSISYLESIGFCFEKKHLGNLRLDKDYFISFYENEFYLYSYDFPLHEKIEVNSKNDLINYINS